MGCFLLSSLSITDLKFCFEITQNLRTQLTTGNVLVFFPLVIYLIIYIHGVYIS